MNRPCYRWLRAAREHEPGATFHVNIHHLGIQPFHLDLDSSGRTEIFIATRVFNVDIDFRRDSIFIVNLHFCATRASTTTQPFHTDLNFSLSQPFHMYLEFDAISCFDQTAIFGLIQRLTQTSIFFPIRRCIYTYGLIKNFHFVIITSCYTLIHPPTIE